MIDPIPWFAVFTRAGALLAVFPLTTAAGVPIRLRIALAAGLACIIAPLLPDTAPRSHTLAALTLLLLVETAVGLALGFVCRMTFFAVEIAGTLVATEMGLMMSSNFNPLNQSPGSAPSVALYWLTAVLFFSLDLHHWMIAAIQRTFEILPPGTAHLGEPVLRDLVQRTTGLFEAGIRIAAPLVAASFLIMLLFSVLARAVPQMNVFHESFPVRTLAGLVIFGMTCTLMAQHIAAYLHKLPEDMLRLAVLMRPPA